MNVDLTLSERLAQFLNPKLATEAEIRRCLQEVPDSQRAEFASRGRERLDGLESVFHPFDPYSQEQSDIHGYPVVRFQSAEQLLQLGHTMETIRLKRNLLREFLTRGHKS